MTQKSRISWLLACALYGAAAAFAGCSVGTEVGNGNKPRPSDPPETSNDKRTNTEGGPADSAQPTSSPERTPVAGSPLPPSDSVRRGNPADAYCIAQGGRLEMKTNASGQYALCHLPDGVSCESWAYFRKECPTPDVRLDTP